MKTKSRGEIAVDVRREVGPAAEVSPWRRARTSRSASSSSDTSSADDASALMQTQLPQQGLTKLMHQLESDEGPTYYSYPVFLLYLVRGAAGMISGEFEDTMASTAKQLRAAAGGDVYLADRRAYMRASLSTEFPEFGVFHISIDESFSESNTCPGIWIETQHFADLRALASMRRAIRQSSAHRSSGLKAVAVVQALLGLTE
jgi:hypothetical protein